MPRSRTSTGPTTRPRSRPKRRATVPASGRPGATGNAGDDLVAALAAGVRIEPRDYQARVVARVVELLSGPHVDRGVALPEARSVIVESPTGSGKTVIGLLVAKWAQDHLGMRVAWTAMRRNLLAQ
ncbi:MAG: DEAD/DEAH box helicase family protein, partial [Planctomycetota bacterium]